MTKMMTASFGGLTLLISYYSIIVNSALIAYVMDTRRVATIVRSLVVLIIVSYCFSAMLRTKVTRNIMVGLGLFLIYFSMSGLINSHFAPFNNYYEQPLDIFFAIEWGILALLVGIERPISSTSNLEVIGDETNSKTTPKLRTNTA